MDNPHALDEGMYLLLAAMESTLRTSDESLCKDAARHIGLAVRCLDSRPTIGNGVRNMADDMVSGDAALLIGMWNNAREMSAAYLHYRDRPTQANHAVWKDATVQFERSFREMVKDPAKATIANTERRMNQTVVAETPKSDVRDEDLWTD